MTARVARSYDLLSHGHGGAAVTRTDGAITPRLYLDELADASATARSATDR